MNFIGISSCFTAFFFEMTFIERFETFKAWHDKIKRQQNFIIEV